VAVSTSAHASLPSGPVTLDPSIAGTAPESTGRGAGVRGTTGGRAHFGALVDAGLDVDGEILTLDQLGPLSISAEAEAEGRFAGDGAIDAWATLEHETLPRDGGRTRMVVRVRGGRESEARAPLDVHLVLDRSSSMQPSWAAAIDAAKMLVSRLTPHDRIHIVAYGTRGEQVLPPQVVGDGARVRRALDGIRVGGGTNIEAGLDIAYGAVGRAGASFRGRSLVILVSDGVPNEGELGADGLGAMAGRARRGHACTTTVIGLGNQFDADVLSAVARGGRGGYYLARSAQELAPALSAEIRAHANVAVRDIRLSLSLGDGVQVRGVFDGHAGTAPTDEGLVLTVPKLAAGEERRIVVSLEVAPGARPRQVATARLDYRVGGAPRNATGDAWIGFGARARVNAGVGGLHAIEGDLGQALAEAGRMVRYGDSAGASARLRAHVSLASAHPMHRPGRRLAHRTDAVAHLATAIDTLADGASYSERREVGLSLGALSVRFAR
jgi:Ca-activated chloride channel family protein